MDNKIEYRTVQRNEFDVAMELTERYFVFDNEPTTIEHIQDIFSKFYAMAKGLSQMSPSDLSKLVDNPELAQILSEY